LLKRYLDIARWVTGQSDATIEAGVAWIAELANALNIPGLRSLGIERGDFDLIVEKTLVSSSMKGNPVRLDEVVLESILEEAL
jgi:alcohol dehydrogenase class IV